MQQLMKIVKAFLNESEEGQWQWLLHFQGNDLQTPTFLFLFSASGTYYLTHNFIPIFLIKTQLNELANIVFTCYLVWWLMKKS